MFGTVARNDIIILKRLDTRMRAEDLKTLEFIEEAWEDIEKGHIK